jgi:hypothetical protein
MSSHRPINRLAPLGRLGKGAKGVDKIATCKVDECVIRAGDDMVWLGGEYLGLSQRACAEREGLLPVVGGETR